MLEARAQPGVLQICLDLLDHRTGGLEGLPGLLSSFNLGLELPQGEVRLPDLGRIADGLGGGEGLPERAFGLVHWRRARALSPLSRHPFTRYFRELVRVASSRH
jgi:hypothetical protein